MDYDIADHVSYFQVVVEGDFEAYVTECLGDVFPCTVGCDARCALNKCLTVVAVKSQCSCH